jgi:hypothetical protein
VLLLLAVVLGVLTVPLTGGKIAALGHTRLRLVPAIFGALALQILVISILPSGSPWLHRVLHVASYGLAAAFLIANRHIKGLYIVMVGGALNLVAILANGGVMPASRAAQETAGMTTNAKEFANSAAVAHPKLLFLGDIIGIPKSVPFANVYSIGDIVIAIGAVIVVHALARRAPDPAASRVFPHDRGREIHSE